MRLSVHDPSKQSNVDVCIMNEARAMSSENLTRIAGTAARGGFFLFVGNTVSTVILAVGAIIIARLLGPSGYGLYILTLLTPVLLAYVSDLGMNYALVRMSARFKSQGDQLAVSRTIRRGFLLKLSVSIVWFSVCYLGAGPISAIVLNRPELAPLLRLAAFLIIFQSISDAATNAFIGLDLMQYSVAIQITFSIFKSALIPALILLGFGLEGAIVGYVLGALIAGVSGAILLFTRHARSGRQEGESQPVKLGILLGYGLPLYLAALITVFLTQYQNIVLTHFATNVEIGNFSAAWNFNSFLMILIYPITTAIFPMFSKMELVNDRVNLSRAFKLAVKYASLVMFPASVAVAVFSGPCLPHLWKGFCACSPVLDFALRCVLPDWAWILDSWKFSQRSGGNQNAPAHRHPDPRSLLAVGLGIHMALGTLRPSSSLLSFNHDFNAVWVTYGFMENRCAT